jgi:hypothetical protein
MITATSRVLSGLRIATPRTLTVIEVGEAGPIGTTPGAGADQYVHSQTLAATVWLIRHNLGRRPAAVSLFSPDWSVQYGQYVVQHLDENTLRVAMDQPIPGIALIE